jgi:predicted transcriptional regulator
MEQQGTEQQEKERFAQKVQNLNISEKVKLAIKGGKDARSILIKDSNKQVMLSVLENPQLTISEVENTAKNRSALEEALRIISKNREWMKQYSVIMALVTNPKTPPAISMRLVPRLKKKDIKLLEKNKGVSEAVRVMAKKTMKAQEKS